MNSRRIFRTPEAAAYIGLSASTLEKLRLGGDGPEFVKLGRRAIGYDKGALDDWIDQRRRGSTSDPGIRDQF